MKRLLGILTILSVISLLVVVSMLLTQGILFKASMLKIGILNLCVAVVLCGFYLTNSHSEPNKLAKMGIYGLGGIVIVLGALISFQIVDPKSLWNILVGLGIIFITLVQLQLLKWDKSKSLLKIMGLLTLLSNLFLSIYFLTLLSSSSIGMVLDIAVIVSVFSFLIGLILTRSKKDKTEEAIA